MSKENKNPHIEILDVAFESDIPHIHFNGFTNTLTAGDSIVVLTHHGKPVATIDASFTVMKTLSIRLTEMIDLLEAGLGTEIFTVEQVKEAMSKNIQGS